jgi:hypothetical protein
LQKRYHVEVSGLDTSGSGYAPVVVSCEHGNESLGSIKCGKFMD